MTDLALVHDRLLDAAIEPEDLILLALADHRGSRCDPPRPDPEPFLRQRLEIYRAAMARPMVTGRKRARHREADAMVRSGTGG